MTRLNISPIQRDEHPTSHLSIGESKVGPNTDVVHAESQGVRVTLRVETVDDGFGENFGKKVLLAPEIGDLFPDLQAGDPFYVDTDAGAWDAHRADSVTISTKNVPPDKLAARLKQENALLHPVTERYDFGDQVVEFTVTDLDPFEPTVVVTEDTEFEFASGVADPAVGGGSSQTGSEPGGSGAGGESGGGGSGSGSPFGGGSGGDDEESDASINIQPTEPEASFAEDVAGLEEVKRTATMVLSLFDPETRERVIDRYGESFADRGGGMMLYGPPGCGKTLVSEAIAHEAKYNTDIEESFGEVVFLEVRGSDVVSKYSGESEKNVEAAFDQAHQIASDGFAVLFFDEVETLIPDRSDDNLQRHERALTNAFLQQMNDVEDNLLVIGATNMPFSIDPAATRRFPIQQFIPQPGEDVMTEVWQKSLGKIAEREDVDCTQLGAGSVGYTPAEIADRVLGSDLQRELVESVARDDRESIDPDTEYLLSRLEQTEPKTVRQYVSSVMKQAQELEGFPEMKTYVEEQAADLGMISGGSPADGTGAE